MFKRRIVKNAICLFLVQIFFFIGCGGHHPNSVSRYMPGDEKRSCPSLYAEIQSIDNEIQYKDSKRRERDTWNVLEFVGGVLFIVPFFFMDAKGSFEAEIDALQARQNQLKIFFADKGCNVADLGAPTPKEVQTSASMDNLKQLMFTTHCSECGVLLTPEDGVNIAESMRLCKKCYEKIGK